jgi:hypothetical protein
MIREATIYDIDELVALFSDMAEIRFKEIHNDKEHWKNELLTQLSIDGAISLVAECDNVTVGLFAGRLIYEPTRKEFVCLEYHWIVRQGYPTVGSDLRQQAERLAKTRGAARMMIHCPNAALERLIARDGYTKTYAIYERIL